MFFFRFMTGSEKLAELTFTFLFAVLKTFMYVPTHIPVSSLPSRFASDPSNTPPLPPNPPPTPKFPSLLISRLLMKDRVQSRDSGKDRKNRHRVMRKGGVWTNCLFVKTCPPVCLFACYLLWCESLTGLSMRTTTQQLLHRLPFHVLLNLSEKGTDRQ